MTELSRWDIEPDTPPPGHRNERGWHLITREGLAPFYLRIGKSSDGRYIANGLLLGAGSDIEVTSNLLREIAVGEIIAAAFWRDTGAAPTKGDLFRRSYPRDAPLSEFVAEGADPVDVPSARGTRAPTSEELARFAATYLEERAVRAHRAMSNAARRSGISRATANRWAARCKELGLLGPEREENE